MSRYTQSMYTEEFGAKSGFSILAKTIVESAIEDWKQDKFDAIGWLHSNQSCLWCDYLGWDKSYMLRMMKSER